uniref:Calreticulin 3 n=1 Tax=Chrysolophus pictus TaxID=9089 RepID=A0A8C3L9Q6_CHRPC
MAAGPGARRESSAVGVVLRLGLLGAVLGTARTAVYFREQCLDGGGWQKRWVSSESRPDLGTFRLSAGRFYGDPVRDRGLQTSENSKFYAISSRFKPFSNKGKTLVIQYTVKHEQKIDCGGGYIKIFSSDLDQKNLSGTSPYYIMFGPDICGSETKKVHVILNYKNKPHPIKKPIRCKVDGYTHLYTLIIRPDQTYEVKIDNEVAALGNLEDDLDFLPPRKINDPAVKKPSDWDDRAHIDDPNDIKPEVRAGTIFDNFLITDDEEYAEDFGDETWGETKDPEKEMNIRQAEEEQQRQRVTEEENFEQWFKKKQEGKRESQKDRIMKSPVEKEEF